MYLSRLLYPSLCAAVATLLMPAATPVMAAVTAAPGAITFSNLTESFDIHLRDGDSPLPSDAVRGATVRIGENTYTHQFNIKRSTSGPAVITLSPNPEHVQVGTFTLIVSTTRGEARVAVNTPLDQLPDMLENRAKALGVTVDDLRAQLGLSHNGPRENAKVTLPEYFYEGHVFTLNMPEAANHDFVWKVNGTVVLEGKGKNTLQHVFASPGDYRIELEERLGAGVVTSWSGVQKVTASPAMEWTVRAKSPFYLEGVHGFRKHTWKIDGEELGEGQTLKWTFREPGVYTIEVKSSEPVDGNPAEFRRLTWNTTATE